MKNKAKAKELNVDFIGGQDKPLTKEEELLISEYIKQLKEKQLKSIKRNSRIKDKKSAQFFLLKVFLKSAIYKIAQL